MMFPFCFSRPCPGLGGRHRASRRVWSRTALASCFSGGLLPTESWAACGCLYACARTPVSNPRAQLRRASLIPRKRHLRSTGADTRLSSNHGSNERSLLRRNFQPRRWRTGRIAITRCCCKSRQNAAAAHPAVCYTPSPHHSCTAGSRSDHGGALAGAP